MKYRRFGKLCFPTFGLKYTLNISFLKETLTSFYEYIEFIINTGIYTIYSIKNVKTEFSVKKPSIFFNLSVAKILNIESDHCNFAPQPKILQY